MSLGLYLSGVVLLAVMIIPLALAGVEVRRALLPGFAGPPARVAETVVALGLMILVAQFLGAVGELRRAPLVAVTAIAALGLAAYARGRPSGAEGGAEPDRRSGEHRTMPSDPLLVVAAVAAVALVAATWGARVDGSLAGGMFGVDTLWYHLPAAARFAQDASIAHVQYFDGEAVTAYYPANSSLLHAVGIVVMKRDVLSPLLNVGWVVLALTAAWSIGRPRGAGPQVVLAVTLLLATPTIVTTQPGEGYNDVVGLALLLSAAALMLNGEGRAAPVMLAAVAAGIGLGTKFTMVAPAVALTLGAAFLVPTGARLGTRLAASARFGAVVLLFGGFWYVRNLFKVGNPLPAADISLGPLTLPSPKIETPTFTVAQYLFDGSAWNDYFLPGFHYAFGPVWWGVVALSLAGMVLAVARGRSRTERLLGVVALLTAASFVFTPQFLGIEGKPLFFRYNLRYVTPALVLGLALLPLVPQLGGRLARRLLAGVMLAVLAATQIDSGIWPSEHDRVAVLAGVALVALAALAVILRRIRPPGPARVAAALACALAVLVAGFALADRYGDHRYTAASVTNSVYPRATFDWARTVSHARIGLSGMFLQYPLYGDDLTNRVQYVGLEGPDGAFAAPRGCRAWRRALAEGGYQYVVVAPAGYPASVVNSDPPEARWTSAGGAASVLRRDSRHLTLFALHGRPDPAGCPGGGA